MTQTSLRKSLKNTPNLKTIISTAKNYLNYDIEKKDLEEIILDKSNEKGIIEMAERDLSDIQSKKYV